MGGKLCKQKKEKDYVKDQKQEEYENISTKTSKRNLTIKSSKSKTSVKLQQSKSATKTLSAKSATKTTSAKSATKTTSVKSGISAPSGKSTPKIALSSSKPKSNVSSTKDRSKSNTISTESSSIVVERPPWIKYVNSTNPHLKHETASDDDFEIVGRLDFMDPKLINKVQFEFKHGPKPQDDSYCCPCPDCDEECNNNYAGTGKGCILCNFDTSKRQRSQSIDRCQKISGLCKKHHYLTARNDRRNCMD